ncbi:MAG: hypothetical protein H7Y41_06590 [Hyphomonadaceae bacterium]|nr:hypothetical protein [Clostridia bacterium]
MGAAHARPFFEKKGAKNFNVVFMIIIKVLLNFFQKITGFKRAAPFVVVRRRRNPNTQRVFFFGTFFLR